MSDKKDNVEEIKIKMMALGNSDVGKTSFVIRYTQDKFHEKKITSIGIDLIVKKKTINNKNYILQFYDTAGQERYKSLSLNTIKSADGVILMYDITSQTSFDSISKWMEGIVENKGNDYPIVLVGNKSDLENERVISKEEGEGLAKKYNLPFYEASVKEGINIEESITNLINKILEKIKPVSEDNDDKNKFQINKKDNNENKKKKNVAKIMNFISKIEKKRHILFYIYMNSGNLHIKVPNYITYI